MSAIRTDEQRALQDSAAAYLARHANAREARDSDRAVWQGMADLGWAAVLVPEDCGGLGLGLAEAAVLMEESGRRLNRSPLFASVALAHPLLIGCATAEAAARLFPAMAEGRVTATVIAGPGLSPFAGEDALEITARPRADGWVLDGTARQVLDGDSADVALVLARLAGGGIGLFEVPSASAGLERAGLAVWDLTRPQASWRFDGVGVAAGARLDRPGRLADGLSGALAASALLLAAEQVGGAARCIELTVAYTLERRQFGRPVASFQAVKHRCAQMLVHLESARSALAGVLAECAGAAAPAALDAVAVARVEAAAAYRFCAAEAIQLHGGVGFTWEYDPQLHFKRAQWGSQWFGSPDAWRDAVADRLLGRMGDA